MLHGDSGELSFVIYLLVLCVLEGPDAVFCSRMSSSLDARDRPNSSLIQRDPVDAELDDADTEPASRKPFSIRYSYSRFLIIVHYACGHWNLCTCQELGGPLRDGDPRAITPLPSRGDPMMVSQVVRDGEVRFQGDGRGFC